MTAEVWRISLLSLMLAFGLDRCAALCAGAARCAALASAEQLRRRGRFCQLSLSASILNRRAAFPGSLAPGARVQVSWQHMPLRGQLGYEQRVVRPAGMRTEPVLQR